MMIRQRFYFFITFFLILVYTQKSQSIIEDIHDIIDVMYHLGEDIFDGDSGPKQKSDAIEFPLLRDKHKKVISQIKVVSQDIDKMVDKVSKRLYNCHKSH